jgi:hypothetical protein
MWSHLDTNTLRRGSRQGVVARKVYVVASNQLDRMKHEGCSFGLAQVDGQLGGILVAQGEGLPPRTASVRSSQPSRRKTNVVRTHIGSCIVRNGIGY